MREPIIAALILAFLLPLVADAQSTGVFTGAVVSACDSSLSLTPGTFGPIALDTSGQACNHAALPGDLICSTDCSVLMTDTGNTVLLQA